MDMDSWDGHGPMVQTWIHGIDMDLWYQHGLMVYTWTHGIYMDSWYRYGLMVYTWTHGTNRLFTRLESSLVTEGFLTAQLLQKLQIY